jgi:hypothetical protein
MCRTSLAAAHKEPTHTQPTDRCPTHGNNNARPSRNSSALVRYRPNLLPHHVVTTQLQPDSTACLRYTCHVHTPINTRVPPQALPMPSHSTYSTSCRKYTYISQLHIQPYAGLIHSITPLPRKKQRTQMRFTLLPAMLLSIPFPLPKETPS